ncbi:hypothetical protein F5148DRAFT_784784 [Russula earlei]|uniref:Uncharacterized protein n=1 Tax=Russula earlei TaxID=71964 RepID=A0ACC0UC41_9AGAM|nr:hypothetical protein F5148DRAFT_784784 [Russula earlei]
MMAVIPPPREYTILLTHLHRPSSSLPLSTHQSLISHFLAQTLTPTPLTATVISSPLFRPFSHAKLVTLVTAFRHAVHLRLKAIENEETTLFTRGIRPRMTEWVHGIVKGFKGGQAVIRFVCAGGILFGSEDLKSKLGADPGTGSVRAKTEDELIIALTEILDLYGAPKDSTWEKEFQPETERGELGALSLALLFAAQFLPHVFSERIKVLPLFTLSSHLMTTIESTFSSGTFLATLPSSCSTTPSGQLSLTTPAGPKQPSFPYDGPGPWSRSAPLSTALRAVIDSPLFSAVASVASISAKILSLLTECSPLDGWNTLEAVATRLEQIASNVESHWAQSALARIENEDDIESESHQVAENIWIVLKTLLFTTIMLSQSIVSTVTYSHPASSPVASLDPKNKKFAHLPTHSSLSLSTLRTLSRLSFVITKFGGVTSTSSDGFAELKRVFYSALDVLSADVEASERFVKALNPLVATSSSSGEYLTDPLTRSRQAFNLACVEQLVPLLSLNTIEHTVFPLCLPHLNDVSHRETYESAHSVILAIFAHQGSTMTAEIHRTGVPEPTFVEKIVPFYARCLLENSADGKLTTAQLRLAYSALTSSASGNSLAMGQFCLLSLLSTLAGASAPRDAQRRHRLRLVLVSTLSALPLIVLPEALNAMSSAIRDSNANERGELAREVFKEIMENVGDQEKEYCLRWWEERCNALAESSEVEDGKASLARL